MLPRNRPLPLDYVSAVRGTLTSPASRDGFPSLDSSPVVTGPPPLLWLPASIPDKLEEKERAMSAAAKPYIPSYAAALKTANPVVYLDGVPIRPRPNKLFSESMAESSTLMEPESASSWADDDESFIMTLKRDQQSLQIRNVEATAAPPRPPQVGQPAQAPRGSRGNRGYRGWKKAGGSPNRQRRQWKNSSDTSAN